MRCHGPGCGANSDDGEEDGEKAQDGFPEEGGIVGVHCGAGRTRHDCGGGGAIGDSRSTKRKDATGGSGRIDWCWEEYITTTTINSAFCG